MFIQFSAKYTDLSVLLNYINFMLIKQHLLCKNSY